MNKAILSGNVGQDPEIQKTTSGIDVAKVNLATNKFYVNKQGEKQTETQWHRLTFFGKTAENVGKYVKKGSKILVEGEIKNNSYTDSQGVQKFFSEVVVDKMEFIGNPPNSGNGQASTAQPQAQAPAQTSAPAPQEQYATPPANNNAGNAVPAGGGQGFDYNPNNDTDDLPF